MAKNNTTNILVGKCKFGQSTRQPPLSRFLVTALPPYFLDSGNGSSLDSPFVHRSFVDEYRHLLHDNVNGLQCSWPLHKPYLGHARIGILLRTACTHKDRLVQWREGQ